MKKQFIIILVIMFVMLFLCGCNESNTSNINSRIIGTWSDSSTTFTFNSDGTYSSNTEYSSGTFETYGARCNLTSGADEYSFLYHFSPDWNKLYLTYSQNLSLTYDLIKQ